MLRRSRSLSRDRRPARVSTPGVERLESKQLLSFDPHSMLAGDLQGFHAISRLSLEPPAPSVGPVSPSAPAIRPYGSRPSAVLSNMRGLLSSTDFGSDSGHAMTSDYPQGSGSGTGVTGGDTGSGSGGYQSWTFESSGTSESSDSGDDGQGGQYSWDDKYTWDYLWTWDTDGNSSWSTHATHMYTFTDSGTTADGTHYNNFLNESFHDDGSGSAQHDGTTHSRDDAGSDDSDSMHADDGTDTFDQGGSCHGTHHSRDDGTSTSNASSSNDDGHAEEHYHLHQGDGSDSADIVATVHATDHSDGNSSASNGMLTSAQSNRTHDDDSNETVTIHLGSAGETVDYGSLDESNDHNEQHSTFDGSSWTDTGQYTSSDDGNDHLTALLTLGPNIQNNHAFGQYNDQASGSTDASGSSTSRWSHDDNGDENESETLSDGTGDIETSGYTTHYIDHVDGGTNASGASHVSWTADSNGNGHGDLSLTAGGNTFDTNGTYHYVEHEEGGTDASGYVTYAYTFDDGGTHQASLTITSGDGTSQCDSTSFSDHGSGPSTGEGHGTSSGTRKPAPGQKLGPEDIVVLSPNIPSDRLKPGAYGPAKTVKTTGLADMVSQLNAIKGDYATLYISGHGGGREKPGTNFGVGPELVFPLKKDVIDAIHHVLGADGVIVIESCQDTTIVSLEDYRAHLQDLADQVGYPIYAIYGDGYYDPTYGAVTDGTWVFVKPKKSK